MSRTRINDRLSEFDERMVTAAEADLDRLLSITPSAEFAARVVARISADHTGRGHRAGWVGLALVSAAALVIISALTLRTDPGLRDSVVTSPQPVHRDIVLRGPTTDKGGAGSEPEPPHPLTRSLKTALPRLDEPEVVIDPSLADAIRRLAASTRNVRLDDTASDSSLLPASDVPLPSVFVEPLTVPELVLKPADQNGGR